MRANTKLPVAIFDFDGVLADSFDAAYKLNDAAMRSIGSRIDKERFRRMYSTNIHQAFRETIGNQELYEQFLAFKEKRSGEYYNTGTVRLFPFVKDMILSFFPRMRLAIVSAAEMDNLMDILSAHGLKDYFDPILASRDLSKTKKLASVAELMCAEAQDIFFITDTAGDIKDGQKVGLKTVAVGWGYQSSKILRKAKPTFFAEKSDELVKFFSDIRM